MTTNVIFFFVRIEKDNCSLMQARQKKNWMKSPQSMWSLSLHDPHLLFTLETFSASFITSIAVYDFLFPFLFLK